MPILAAYSKKISPKINNVSEKQENKNSNTWLGCREQWAPGGF